jgi:serine/threonine-protein kinase
VLIYQMLTGQVPFTGDSPVAVAVRHVSEDVPPPSAIVPDVPAGLDAVVARATAKHPLDRFASADEMGAALRESLLPGAAWALPGAATTTVLPAAAMTSAPSSGPSTARLPLAPPGPDTRAGRREQARSATSGSAGPARRWVVAAGGVGVLALAGILGLFTSGSDDPARPQPVEAVQTATATTTTRPSTTTSSPTTTARPTPTGPTVPSGLVGRDVDAVEELLKGLGYRVQKVEFASDRPEGSVLMTVPAGGTELRPGQTVVLVISKGEGDRRGTAFVVPSGLVGQRARTVERELRGKARVTMIQVRSSREPGTVVATWPKAGATSETGRLLLFVASDGNG